MNNLTIPPSEEEKNNQTGKTVYYKGRHMKH